MPVDPNPLQDIPAETSIAARNLYNVQHIYLRIGDHMDSILNRVDVGMFDATSRLSTPTLTRLGLASAFQLAEGLADPQAAESTYQRLDWKYALFLPVKHPGISEHELCHFRRGLYSTASGQRQFAILLAELRRYGLFPRTTGPLLDTQTALERICQITRLYALDLAIKEALGMLVSFAPNWLLEHVSPHWYERYSTRRLSPGKRFASDDLVAEANRLGADIWHLLKALQSEDAKGWVGKTEIQTLSRLFYSQFSREGDEVQWNSINCGDCTQHHLAKGGTNYGQL
ncbi:MAG TPA: hypothetical protein VN364_09905 [Bellilinea sp.]|nr:hypothetical protein [Bellilinea sp.]